MINTESIHYKGKFGSVYEVNQKYPLGGAVGDYVDILGWAHYWNADRGTWCVNENRDEYWDEAIQNALDHVSELSGSIDSLKRTDANNEARILQLTDKVEQLERRIFNILTEEQYVALPRKDANTIYFITE